MFSFKDFVAESKQSGSNCTVVQYYNPAGNYMFKVNNRNTRTRLTIKTP